jgi:hypothetical protein
MITGYFVDILEELTFETETKRKVEVLGEPSASETNTSKVEKRTETIKA